MSEPHESLQATVAEALAAAPEPEDARRRAGDLLAAARSCDGEALAAAEPATVARVLLAVCGVAPFLARHLQRRPEALLALCADDLSQPRTLEQHDTALRDLAPGDEEAALRRYKYAELARLCTRDACDAWVPLERSGETLREITILADALLTRSFEIARARVAERSGPARWGEGDAAFEPGLAVLGLGKLGGGELNFSSDVDLVYVFESPPPERGPLGAGPADFSPEGWASRVVTEFGRIVSSTTVDGFLYRIDLDLRPEGAGGPRVVGSDPLTAYYDGSAALWEKAAFTKARPVAGDVAFGWRIVRAVHPMIYRSTMDYAAVGAIREMKRRVEEAHGSGEGFNVKLGTGGIRDVEFVTQALQLLHGGRVPDVRGRSTQEALRALAAHAVLPDDETERLLAAYRFLRRLENRLQMEDERQTHQLPDDEAAHRRAARAMGFTAESEPAGFDASLAEQRSAVRETFARFFAEGDEERVLALFQDVAPRLLQLPGARQMIERLAARFAREVSAAPDPDLALNNLARFVEGVGPRSVYYGLLLDRPELVGRLTTLFGASRYLSNFLAAHPDLIEPVFADPDVLVLSPEELRKDLAELRAELERTGDRDPVEAALAALRLFHHRQLVNVGLLDLDGRITRAEAEHALTDLAEACLEAALELARKQTARFAEATAAGELLVVGMGKLASREMSYGSDLDLVFLYRVEGEGADLLEAQSGFARQAQKLIGSLDTPTAEGSCYCVDARLRPSGGQGALVTSLGAFRAHHEKSAMAWERQALLRARPVAGSTALGERFDAERRDLLLRPAPDELAEEMHRVRVRMQDEIGKESAGRRDLKVGRGGLVDVEFAVQYLQLRHGAEHPELLDVGPLEGHIRTLASHGILDERNAATLTDGWDFLQRLSSRLRIVQNRSISDLRADRTDLDAVARALGYTPSSLSGDARRPLLDDYKRSTEAIRRVYLDVLGVAEAAA